MSYLMHIFGCAILSFGLFVHFELPFGLYYYGVNWEVRYLRFFMGIFILCFVRPEFQKLWNIDIRIMSVNN